MESLHLMHQSTSTVSIKALFVVILAISAIGWLLSNLFEKRCYTDANNFHLKTPFEKLHTNFVDHVMKIMIYQFGAVSSENKKVNVIGVTARTMVT
jgi:cytochrome b